MKIKNTPTYLLLNTFVAVTLWKQTKKQHQFLRGKYEFQGRRLLGDGRQLQAGDCFTIQQENGQERERERESRMVNSIVRVPGCWRRLRSRPDTVQRPIDRRAMRHAEARYLAVTGKHKHTAATHRRTSFLRQHIITWAQPRIKKIPPTRMNEWINSTVLSIRRCSSLKIPVVSFAVWPKSRNGEIFCLIFIRHQLFVNSSQFSRMQHSGIQCWQDIKER